MSNGRPAPALQGPRFAFILLGVIIAAGTLGYVLIEGWSVWEGLYMAVTTVATVGFREVHPMSRAGEAFTLLLIVSGVGTAFYTATLLATHVVEGGLKRRFVERRLKHMLENLKDHFILCGYGRIGSLIADELHQQDVPFVVVEKDPERVSRLVERGWVAVAADASHEDVLVRVGIHRARGLIAAVGTDAENVYAVLTARVTRPDLFIIARVEADDAEHKLRRAGADRVISPYHIGASHMAQTALRPAVVDFVQLATSSGHLDLSMEQVHIREGSGLVGQTILDAGIRQKYGVIVVAIRRTDGTMDFNPPHDATIRAGDEMVVLGRPESVKALGEQVAA